MAYTPLIHLDEDTENDLIQYLDNELWRHYAERGDHINDIMEEQAIYWAVPDSAIAEEPFYGASTLIIPLGATAVESIYADLMTTIKAIPQLYSVHAVNPIWETSVKAYERYLNREIINVAQGFKAIGDTGLEFIKHGTGIIKAGYERVIKYGIRTVAGIEQEFPVEVKRGVCLSAVSNGRFLMPFTSQDAQSAEWCGEEHDITPYQLEMAEHAGLYYEGISEDLEIFFTNAAGVQVNYQGQRETTRNQEELESREPFMPKMITFHEFQLAWDVDGSKKRREIIVHYHRLSHKIMAVRNNSYSDLHREYRHATYFPIEHRWFGIGVLKQLRAFQDEITAIHRQSLDNGTLANIKMFILHRNAGYGADEPIFPGKIWLTQDMEWIKELSMGEVNQSGFALANATILQAQQRSGVSELTLGQEQVGTPGTATSDLARLQQAKKRNDLVHNNFNDLLTQVGVDCAVILQQYGPRNVDYFDNAEGGQLLKQTLQIPDASIREGLIFKVSAVTQQQNKIIDRQNWVQIGQSLMNYYTSLMQIAQMAGDPKLMQLIMKTALTAATEGERQLLESFDVRNIDKLIVKELEIGAMQNGGETQQPNGQNGVVPGNPVTANPAIQALFQAISRSAGGAGGIEQNGGAANVQTSPQGVGGNGSGRYQ